MTVSVTDYSEVLTLKVHGFGGLGASWASEKELFYNNTTHLRKHIPCRGKGLKF